MGLGLSQRGNFTPYCKYDARAGRWFKKGGEQGGDVDITNGFAALFDFEEIEVGYIYFPQGAAPQFCTQHVSMGVPAAPADKNFKQGFRLSVALPSQLGGGVYELASTAFALISEIDKMFDAYKAAPEAAQGLLPVVAMNGTTIIESRGKDKNSQVQVSRNYAPNLSIVAWSQRPATMPKGPRVPAQQPAAAPHAQQQAPAQPSMFSQPQQVQHQQPAAFGQNTAQDSRQQAQQPAAQPQQAGFGAAPTTGSERVAPPPQAQQPAQADTGGANGFG